MSNFRSTSVDKVFIFILAFAFYTACDANLFLDMFYKNWRTFPEAFEILSALLVSAHSADFCVEEGPNWNLLG